LTISGDDGLANDGNGAIFIPVRSSILRVDEMAIRETIYDALYANKAKWWCESADEGRKEAKKLLGSLPSTNLAVSAQVGRLGKCELVITILANVMKEKKCQ
jgi:hypothetical protein